MTAQSAAASPLPPEQSVVVTLSDQGVTCRRPGGTVESVAWDDLQAVIIETTDAGPFAPDVYWILIGQHGGCVVPQGASGEDALLDRLQRLAGFDNAAFIEAMTCIENRRFVCWKRQAGGL